LKNREIEWRQECVERERRKNSALEQEKEGLQRELEVLEGEKVEVCGDLRVEVTL
jgi:hypothetical protein